MNKNDFIFPNQNFKGGDMRVGKNFISLLLVGILFISGCVEGTGLQALFGSMGEKRAAPNDVLMIEDLTVIPRPPIPADSEFEVSFLIKNIASAEEGVDEATNVGVYLYDWGRCKPLDEYGNEINKEIITYFEGKTIYPGAAEIVSWTFRAPSNFELGKMEGECPIRFKVNYDFSTYTTSDVTIITKEHLEELIRAGETPVVTPVQTQSSGPVKINIDVQADQPVRKGLTIPVIITVEDKGSGFYQKVPAGSLRITFPSDLDVTCDSNWFEKINDNTFTNSQDILLIRGKTPPLRCDLDSSKANIVAMKTYNIVGEFRFTYTIYGET